MNERIKELITEAFDTAEYPADQKYRIEPNKVFCQKFAELIVGECADIATMNQFQWDSAGGYVLKHFGVEP